MSSAFASVLDRPVQLYYLYNFRCALQWLRDRYADLLSASENTFIEEFNALPLASQALLVRLIMRKGPHFRASKILYAEIGSVDRAVAPLVSLEWINPRPLLRLEELFKLATRVEIAEMFPGLPIRISKAQALDVLQQLHTESLQFEEWRGSIAERVYFVAITPLCTRLRLLFFGNFTQQWSEFVLADLGVSKYEKVAFSDASRAFHSRRDIDDFFKLYDCRRQLNEAVALADVLAQVPLMPMCHEWLESRRSKLIFRIAREFERRGEADLALPLYLKCTYPGARLRAIRTLERAGRHGPAHELASAASASPSSAAEAQKVTRVLVRLERRLKHIPRITRRPYRPERLDLIVPGPNAHRSVEEVAREYFVAALAPVYYVENALVNSLFGLLCWEAIFAPISGAFFHPFHVGPADLFSASFRARRAQLFDRCLDRLDRNEYPEYIKGAFREKRGIQSPFVSWGILSEALVDVALACMPASHLRPVFERLLSNLNENRSGLPDLVQFWPQENRYRLIEVKGPGDRLQDNQQRWMEFCLESGIPVAVCHVRWA